MTGVVAQFSIQGEAVEPGQPLFEVRLTHEDLLQVQTEFLRTVEELDVIGREVAGWKRCPRGGQGLRLRGQRRPFRPTPGASSTGDQDWVVVANDGALKIGSTVGVSAAHQLQLTLKNKSGGGADPHAGHNH